MSGQDVALAVSVFLACAVEAVEALTIVLAVGVTRSWRSALIGVGAATLVLAVIVAALGPALTALPINALRVVVGGLLLIFGLQWLRKAVLRAAGLKALHDEDKAFVSETDAARAAGRAERTHDRGQDDCGCTNPDQRRAPPPDNADREHDRQRLDHLDRAGQKCRREQKRDGHRAGVTPQRRLA